MRSDRDHLLAAARLALRGRGRAEPNPLVGCVIVSREGEVVGWGHHERFGGPHAEIHALRRAGPAARGATAYITLAPCHHTGKTGPCSAALIEAGVARVIVARDDPHEPAAGGLDALRRAGIEAVVTEVCPEAISVSDPFVHRVTTGRPWVIAKWAQTIDGRVATRAGASRWISGEASRRLVHRERGRVDAILTGIGTVLRDDPMLTARGVRIRRVARRVVVDPQLKIPLDSDIVRTAREVPATIVCGGWQGCDAASRRERETKAREIEGEGAELISVEEGACGLSLEAALRLLSERHEVTNVLVEAGPGLMSRLFRDRLVNEAWVFIGGRLLGDEEAMPPVRGLARPLLEQATPLKLLSQRRRGGDVVLRYRIVGGDRAG